jgi:hypothetical protein
MKTKPDKKKDKDGKKKQTATTKPGPRPGTKAEKIVALKVKHPTMTEREIAERVECAKTNVHETLERYGIKPEKIETYRKNRADIFAGLQDRIFSKLTDVALEKTPAIQLVTAASILYDKERLERGQANQITSIQSVSVETKATLDELRALKFDLSEAQYIKQNDPKSDVSEVIDVTPESDDLEISG